MPHQSCLSSTIIPNINEMELHQLQMLTFELQEMRKTMEKGNWNISSMYRDDAAYRIRNSR